MAAADARESTVAERLARILESRGWRIRGLGVRCWQDPLNPDGEPLGVIAAIHRELRREQEPGAVVTERKVKTGDGRRHEIELHEASRGRVRAGCVCGWIDLTCSSSELGVAEGWSAHMYARGFRTKADIAAAAKA